MFPYFGMTQQGTFYVHVPPIVLLFCEMDPLVYLNQFTSTNMMNNCGMEIQLFSNHSYDQNFRQIFQLQTFSSTMWLEKKNVVGRRAKLRKNRTDNYMLPSSSNQHWRCLGYYLTLTSERKFTVLPDRTLLFQSRYFIYKPCTSCLHKRKIPSRTRFPTRVSCSTRF